MVIGSLGRPAILASVNREGEALFHQSLTTGKAHWKARAVTVGSTIAGILEECGSGSDSGAGRRIAGAACAALGVDRAVPE
ncbi:hypothetical protein BQ8794_70214 [Mesorhizobium prunaredense]|uniref:Uncharacterized protein n=1 Tax=Mesorhizobium prunaredense TaxID=1631249 RepID=A0A1R3VH99_9HYPH|nr:hypothetical protein BQ8794_70214 [Mesorhizobium prunaredense]